MATTLKDYIGKVVGYIRINDPDAYKYTRQYETASWFEIVKPDVGVYPLVLARGRFTDEYSVQALNVPGTIVENWFQSLWAGVPVGKPWDSKAQAGEATTVPVVRDSLISAIKLTGASPNHDADWYVNPELYELVIAELKERTREAVADIERTFNDFMSDRPSFLHRCGKIIEECCYQCGAIQDIIRFNKTSSMNYNEINSEWKRECAKLHPLE